MAMPDCSALQGVYQQKAPQKNKGFHLSLLPGFFSSQINVLSCFIRMEIDSVLKVQEPDLNATVGYCVY